MKVAIAGYGVEGKVSYQYYASRGDEVVIADERAELVGIPENVRTILGPGAFSQLAEFDLIIRSPSIRPDKLPYGDKVWSATNEFFARCPAPIIGVTGTKGKGTTSSLIASILRAAGRTVHLVGNIGLPALQVLPDITSEDIVVFELSSFQLWDLQKSPHIAVILGIEPDHLDVHTDFDEYVAAKANIVKFQTPSDIVVYHPTAPSRDIAWQSAAKHVCYGDSAEGGVHAAGSDFMIFSRPICRVNVLQIKGQHNISNACAAITACLTYTTDAVIITKGLEEFSGLPHRLKFVREINGVEYYDDNYSSAPSATLAAIEAFTVPEVLILGGYDKGVDLSGMAARLAEWENLKHVVLIGQTGLPLRILLKQHDYHSVTLLENKPSMQTIVDVAAEKATSGDVIIMSPACASFDMFKNFADRGDQFVAAVEAL